MKICEYVKSEINYILEEANFTEDERNVFLYLSKGYTIENTADKCNMGISTVNRIKKRIWTKIERLKGI